MIPESDVCLKHRDRQQDPSNREEEADASEEDSALCCEGGKEEERPEAHDRQKKCLPQHVGEIECLPAIQFFERTTESTFK